MIQGGGASELTPPESYVEGTVLIVILADEESKQRSRELSPGCGVAATDARAM